MVGGEPRGLEVEGGLGAVEGDDRIAVGRTVAHGRVRNTALVLGPFPPRAAHGDVDDVMMRFRSHPAVATVNKLVRLQVRVAGNDQCVRALFD